MTRDGLEPALACRCPGGQTLTAFLLARGTAQDILDEAVGFDPLTSGVIPNDSRQIENRNATGVVPRAGALLAGVQAQAEIAARSLLCKSHPTREATRKTYAILPPWLP